jgi:hypothetical protein
MLMLLLVCHTDSQNKVVFDSVIQVLVMLSLIQATVILIGLAMLRSPMKVTLLD